MQGNGQYVYRSVSTSAESNSIDPKPCVVYSGGFQGEKVSGMSI